MTVKPTYEELEQRIKELESESVEAKPTQEELQEVEEKALRESEEKYRTVFENMTQGAFCQRADGVLVDVNSAALKMFGLTKNEFLCRTSETPVWDVVHEDGSLFPGTEHPSMMALRTGKPVLGVVAGVRNERTGDRIWMEINAIPEFRPGASKPFQVMVTMHDVTQRKQAAKVLQESENAYRTLAENLPGMVYRVFVRENNRMEFFNKMLQPMTGYRIEELAAGEVCSIEPLILSEDREAVVTAVKRALQEHQPFQVEYRLRHKMGEAVYFLERGRPIYDEEDEEPLYIDGIIMDITERKQNEERLRNHAQILNQIHDSVISTDLEGYVVTWNTGAERIFGYSAEEGLGKHISFVYPPDQHGFLKYEVIAPLKKKGRHEIEVRMRRKSGQDFYAHLSLSLLRNEEGAEIGMIGSAVDLTERRQIEEELRKSREELEIRVQERTAELAVINEELRVENEERLRVEIELRESEDRLRELSKALLSTQERERKLIAQEIHDSMGASLAAAKFKVESALKEMDENNPQAKASLENVIPILQGTMEEARRIQMSLRPSILDDLGILATINWFCRQFQSTYSQISVKQEIDIQENEVPESLKIVIYRVLQEALNNIAKYSKAPVVLLNLRKAKSAIQLVIRDSGQGFDLDEAYSRKGMTKGLGLDSMRERTELSGGSFSIESRKGGGTVIRAAWAINRLSS